MRKALIFGLLCVLGGCAKTAPVAQSPTNAASSGPVAADDGTVDGREPADRKNADTWIGASPEGSMLSSDTRDTFLGVWVDVPETRPEMRPPMEVALVVDTSGSMAGAKIENARTAAAMLVRNLKDGDIVALDAFSDHARTIVGPTRLDATSRTEILRRISEVTPSGSTNMFAGLSLGESQLAAAPASHTIRRVVVVSDGIANVGPSSPDSLGMLAERGLSSRTQVTSLGVGNDYDERTLNALAIRSSGRMYHLSEPRELAQILRGELDLLDGTRASEAFVEIVPAPGVQVLGAEGIRADFTGGGLRIPLGALHSGQHREALVRVRITDPSMFEGHSRSLASVRLRFRDPQEGDLERIQEVVARTELSSDSSAVARNVNSRTKAIVAIVDAAQRQLDAAQRINDGQFGDADKELEAAQRRLVAQADVVTAPAEKRRLQAAAGKVASARAAASAMPSAPKAVQREGALRMNADAMHESGY